MSKKNTLLWEIRKADLDKQSYVFGTMHIKDQCAFRYQDQVYAAINRCTAFATEFNLEEVGGNISAEAMDLPDGQTLHELFSPKIYLKLQNIFYKHTGLNLDMFAHAQPLLIINLLSERLLSSDMPVSLDEHFWNYAKSQDKICLGIETYEEQLAILQKIPLSFQLQALVKAAKNFSRFRKQLMKMTKMYEQADIAKLHKASRKSVGGMRKLLLYDRNHIMAERIARLANEQAICVAIGAGHLGGKKGVLRLLKLEGYKIKPVQYEAEIAVD